MFYYFLHGGKNQLCVFVEYWWINPQFVNTKKESHIKQQAPPHISCQPCGLCRDENCSFYNGSMELLTLVKFINAAFSWFRLFLFTKTHNSPETKKNLMQQIKICNGNTSQNIFTRITASTSWLRYHCISWIHQLVLWPIEVIVVDQNATMNHEWCKLKYKK